MDWVLMVVSLIYASIITYGFGVALAERIRYRIQGIPQPFSVQSSFHFPPGGWWRNRLLLLAFCYLLAAGLTWGAVSVSPPPQYGWEITSLATVFSASMSIVFATPALLLSSKK